MTLLKIGEVAKQTSVSVATLRYYETLKLLCPIKRGKNGYRYYSGATIKQVQFIKKSQVLGFSLEEIRQILDIRDRGEPPCLLVQNLTNRKIEQLELQIQQMIGFKRELEGHRDRWSNRLATHPNEEEICPLIASISLPYP